MEKKSDTYQIATDIQWEYAGDGIVRQIMGYDEHLMMVKVKFNQGAIGTLHQHIEHFPFQHFWRGNHLVLHLLISGYAHYELQQQRHILPFRLAYHIINIHTDLLRKIPRCRPKVCAVVVLVPEPCSQVR